MNKGPCGDFTPDFVGSLVTHASSVEHFELVSPFLHYNCYSIKTLYGRILEVGILQHWESATSNIYAHGFRIVTLLCRRPLHWGREFFKYNALFITGLPYDVNDTQHVNQ